MTYVIEMTLVQFTSHRAQRRLKFSAPQTLIGSGAGAFRTLDGGAIATLLQFGDAARVFDINARAIQHHHIEGIGSGAAG